MSKRRIAITGVGPVSAAGTGMEQFSGAILSGVTGVKPVTAFDVSHCSSRIGALIDNFEVGPYLLSQKTYLDRNTELSFAAISLALKDAGIEPAALDKNAALLFGTAYGNMETARIFFADLLEKGPRFTKPVLFPHAYSNTSISMLAMEYGITGYHVNFSSGSVSSALAIAGAFDILRSGRTNLALAGGCDALNQMLFTGLDREGLLASAAEPSDFSGPYRRSQSGFVAGEGSGFMVLEEMDAAVKRGASILGEITGCAMANSPVLSSEDIFKVMSSALSSSGMKAADIDLIVGHGDGSNSIDTAELQAISRLAASAGRSISATSLKITTANTFGASGVLQMISAVSILNDGIVPAIGGKGGIDAIAGVDLQMETTKRSIDSILVNCIDRGGAILSMVVKQCRN